MSEASEQRAGGQQASEVAAGAGACWSCAAAVPRAEPFCPACGRVQPPGQADHFTRLGIERTAEPDPAELDRRYFALQRRLHPDRFAARPPREKAISQAQATSLNEAYRTLRDSLRRAEYLVRLEGGRLDGENGRTVNDPALLMEAMEMREALSEAASPAEVEGLRAQADAGIAGCRAAFASALGAGRVEDAARDVLRWKYLAKLAEETRQKGLALASAAAGDAA
jgi:molecular chaperone HscB